MVRLLRVKYEMNKNKLAFDVSGKDMCKDVEAAAIAVTAGDVVYTEECSYFSPTAAVK